MCGAILTSVSFFFFNKCVFVLRCVSWCSVLCGAQGVLFPLKWREPVWERVDQPRHPAGVLLHPGSRLGRQLWGTSLPRQWHRWDMEERSAMDKKKKTIISFSPQGFEGVTPLAVSERMSSHSFICHWWHRQLNFHLSPPSPFRPVWPDVSIWTRIHS